VQATEATEATGPAGTAGEGEPAPEPLRRRLDLPSGRLCFAGLDEAFAARNAELHPGAFGDVLELEPGCYELELARAARPVGPSRGGEPAAEVPRLRRGDERIAALVRGGLPLALVSGLLVGAIAVAIGGWLSGSILAGRLAGWSLAGGAVLLAAWAIVVRTGAMPPVQRVIAARRALADASPDAILAVRRLGEADQSSGPADGATDAVTGGAGSAT